MIDTFERQWPNHEMKPYAEYERLRHAQRTSDADQERRVRQALTAFPGHPVLRMVLSDLAHDALPLLERSTPIQVEDPIYPRDIVERLSARLDELRSWSAAYHLPFHHHSFTLGAADILVRMGRADLVLAQFPARCQPYIQALREAGDYTTLARDYAYLPARRQWALLAAARYAEMDLEQDHEAGVWALFDQGRIDEMRAFHAPQWPAGEALIQLGEHEEVLGTFGERHLHLWAMALNALGRHEELLRRWPNQQQARIALIRLKRYDEVVARFPADHSALALIAVNRLIDGDRPACDHMLRRLRAAQIDCTDYASTFARFIMPAVVPACFGESVDPHIALAPALAMGRPVYGQML